MITFILIWTILGFVAWTAHTLLYQIPAKDVVDYESPVSPRMGLRQKLLITLVVLVPLGGISLVGLTVAHFRGQLRAI